MPLFIKCRTGRDASGVAVAELGTTAEDRYEVVQPTDATELSKLAQTQNLTGWRTLWAECDHMTSSVAPSIDGLVASELARACVEIKTCPNNQYALVVDVTEVKKALTLATSVGYRAN